MIRGGGKWRYLKPSIIPIRLRDVFLVASHNRIMGTVFNHSGAVASVRGVAGTWAGVGADEGAGGRT